MIRLLTLGGLAVQRRTEEGVDAPRTSGKRNALLAYLAVERPNGSHSRDTLLALFWPESDDRHARDSLKQLLRSLRHELGDEVFNGGRGSGIALDDSQVWCDAVELSAVSEQGKHARVLELYRGDFLAGFHLNGSVEFEDWVEGQRRRLREKAVTSGKLLAEEQEEDGEHDAAIQTMKRLRELQPYDESCLRRLMRLHLDAGERAKAVAAYEDYAELLATDFDTSPSAETVALLERARTRVVVEGERKVVVIDRADVTQVSEVATLGGGRRPAWQGAGLVAAGMLLAIAGMSVWSASRPEGAPAGLVRFSIIPPEDAPFDFWLNRRDLVISSDGMLIAYNGPNPSGDGAQINLQSIGELVATPLRGVEGFAPFFSPDGAWVGFVSNEDGGALQRVSRFGGPPVTLTNASHPIFGASWGVDDQIIFGTGSHGPGLQPTGDGLHRVSADGGETERLTTLDRDRGEAFHIWPTHIAGQDAVIFVITGGDPLEDPQLAVLNLRNGEIKRLGVGGSSPRYLPTGHLVYNEGHRLFAVPFDAASLRVTGNPVLLLQGVRAKGSSGALFSVSDNGRLIYVPGGPRPTGANPRELVWVDRQGGEEPLPTPLQRYVLPRVSPDGRRVAVSVWEEGPAALWVYNVATGGGFRLTDHMASTWVPVWTPDGERIVFSSTQDAPRTESFNGSTWRGNLYAAWADGSSEAQRLTTSDVESQVPTGVTADGQLVLYSVASDGSWKTKGMPIEPGADGRRVKSWSFNHGNTTPSPDGRWLAYQSYESGVPEIYVEPFPGPGQRVQVSIAGGDMPVWSYESDELFYRSSDGMMMSATLLDGATPEVGTRTVLFSTDEYHVSDGGLLMYDVAPDGRLLMIRRVATDGDRRTWSRHINVVLNWFEELRERVPN